MLIHLGYSGFRATMENALENARLLSQSLEATSWFRCVSDIHRKKGQFELVPGEEVFHGENSASYNAGLPVVAFTLSDDFKRDYPHVKQVAVSNLMRAKQYIIPNYPLPPNEDSTEILRVVVRESMSRDLVNKLITDLVSVMENIMSTSTSVDLAAWQPTSPSVEKKMGTLGEKNAEHMAGEPQTPASAVSTASTKSHHGHHHHKQHPMKRGIHSAVC